jgi:hypothetical protein
MVQNSTMRLDHVSYVTSHDQLADTVQRLGSRLGSTFVDGGIHPRFGTRNFTASLKNVNISRLSARLITQQQQKHLGVKRFQRKLTKVVAGSLGFLAPGILRQSLKNLAAKQQRATALVQMVQI